MTKLAVDVQIATDRRGVPHASSLRRWATAAFRAALRRSAVSLQRPASSHFLTIRIVGAAESRRLNRDWRGKNRPTNVLSFPGDLPALRPRLPAAALGDLAICAPVVAREAREQGKSQRAHWAHMVIHGVLHLLGYDHENDRDAEQMESAEISILAEFGFPNPYV